MNNTQRIARSALFSLKEATLKVLYEARERGEGYIQPLEIRKRLGIPRADEPGEYANTLIFGVPYYLENDQCVEHVERQGWKITASLFDAIQPENEV